MLRRRFLLIVIALVLSAVVTAALWRTTARSSAHPPGNRQPSPAVELTPASFSLLMNSYASGLERPVGIANAGDYRLFVLEQEGRIRIIQRDGRLETTPFLDISDRVDASSREEGLLGLAFHPDYGTNGLFYVNYIHTSSAGERRTRISSFKVNADLTTADPDSESILLTVDQPNSNHNAGKISFGPDGYLYVPLGDGGGQGDALNNAQNPELLLGKVTRIDVDSGPGVAPDCKGLGNGQYTVPVSNPAIDGPGGACDEIWASGLRNPWQASFDALTGDFFIGDVGQNRIEEVNFQPAASAGGENYGWRCYEGSEEFNMSAGCASVEAYTFPIFEYNRPTAYGDCSVTGGYVYRGSQYPLMAGRYFLTDYCSGRFWDLRQMPDESWQVSEHEEISPQQFGNAAFGERCDGELFVANEDKGIIYHLTAGAAPAGVPHSDHADEDFVPDTWVYLPLVQTSGCR